MERFSKIVQDWFLAEPVFFKVYCTHQLTANPKLKVPLRTGKGRIEYSPTLVEEMSRRELETRLAVEIVRILLKHPYERQPLGVNRAVLSMASDVVVSQNYELRNMGLKTAEMLGLPLGQCYEWYVKKLKELPPMMDDLLPNEDEEQQSKSGSGENVGQEAREDSTSGNLKPETNPGNNPPDNREKGKYPLNTDFLKKAAQQSELWEENDEQRQSINEIIENTKDWGSIPMKLRETILSSAQGHIDYRRMMRGFSTSVLSSHRRLTRMRPNRRSGFDYMGNRYDLQARLLVAVDVSGSISSKTISYFLSVIGRFFKHGVSAVDVIQFDTEIKDDVVKLTEARQRFRGNKLEVKGRGGTSFQPVFDYLKEHNRYDGLAILTDGYAPEPKINFFTRTKILWVCQNRDNYNTHKAWIRKTGSVCYMMGVD